MGIWNRLKSFFPWVKAQKQRNLEDAAAYLLDEWRKTVGIQGSRRDRSAPGQPPRRQTGTLQASLFARVTDGLLVIGGTAKHLRYLEDGTRRMMPRPSRGPTLERCRPKLLEIMARTRKA